MVSQGGTGGVAGRGGPEEDRPETRETHNLPPARSGSGPRETTQRARRWTPAGPVQKCVPLEVGTPREDRRRSCASPRGPGQVWPRRYGSPMAA